MSRVKKKRVGIFYGAIKFTKNGALRTTSCILVTKTEKKMSGINLSERGQRLSWATSYCLFYKRQKHFFSFAFWWISNLDDHESQQDREMGIGVKKLQCSRVPFLVKHQYLFTYWLFSLLRIL